MKVAGLLGLVAKLAGRGAELLERLDRFDEELTTDPARALHKAFTYPINTGIRLGPSGRRLR
ncbi:hypothetical protein [Pyrococcus kukulkanii]|uniref:hypothetical protein n=1 Tax=Pyrococcus kukulkanii TaxID=1609559 RepID=UPI003563ACEE